MLKRRSVWIRVGLLGLVVLTPASANLTNDITVITVSNLCSQCTKPVYIRTFGSTSVQGLDFTGGVDYAATIWEPDHFGMFASASLNSTAGGQMASGYTYSGTIESILIPAQQGMVDGDPGILQLAYHLDGTATIELASSGQLNGVEQSFGKVRFGWAWNASPFPTVTSTHLLADYLWAGIQVHETVDQDVIASVPFFYGELFYYVIEVSATADAGTTVAGGGPSFGFAEADFLHTGTLLGGTVFDKNGNPIADPLVMSDSGFDYVHPQGAAGSAVPEPSSVIPLAACLGGWLLMKRLRKARS